MDFAIPADYRMKIKESDKIDKYLDLAREPKEKRKKTLDVEDVIDTNCNRCTWNCP